MSGCQFVVTSLAREQRPSAAMAPADKRAAIFPLPVSIVVIAVPAWAKRSLHFQHGVHHLERIYNDGIVRLADAIAHEFQKTCIHDVFGWEYVFRAPGRRLAIGGPLGSDLRPD